MCLFEGEKRNSSHQGGTDMISIADESVHIQTSSDSQCATPSWLGEVALVASHFRKQGILSKIGERVRLARRLSTEESSAGLRDRQGNRWLVFDVDGTREAARQRALPQTPDRPAPQRRLRPLCAP